MCSRRHGGGRVRSTTPAEDRYIVLSAKRNRRTTAQRRWQISFLLPQESRSPKNCCQTFEGGGLYARRPVVCVPLTRQHRTARLQWCREHHNWTEQDWACVLFSDESRFSLSSDCRRQLLWRESGTAYRPENIQEKDRYPTCSIMVWAGIMINGRTRLHVVANGTMTGQQYIDEVLLPHGCLDSEGIQRLVWPACSPDLNPIENVWDALGMQVTGRNYPPTNKNTLIRALTEEWDNLPQQLLDNVVQMRPVRDPSPRDCGLSRSTLASRVDEIAENLRDQHHFTISTFQAYSIAINESTDIRNIAQLAIFIRGCDVNLKINEELLEVISMHNTTTGADIFDALMEVLKQYKLPLDKLVCLAADRAPTMTRYHTRYYQRICCKIKRNMQTTRKQ
ncbi:general transcription factor II-I repeat domain-containing protein 2 [Trichonephila clavipes]|nr:general transcription factor II-I repeat domain-containing protein 2 [Trichonephila clavipes]